MTTSWWLSRGDGGVHDGDDEGALLVRLHIPPDILLEEAHSLIDKLADSRVGLRKGCTVVEAGECNLVEVERATDDLAYPTRHPVPAHSDVQSHQNNVAQQVRELVVLQASSPCVCQPSQGLSSRRAYRPLQLRCRQGFPLSGKKQRYLGIIIITKNNSSNLHQRVRWFLTRRAKVGLICLHGRKSCGASNGYEGRRLGHHDAKILIGNHLHVPNWRGEVLHDIYPDNASGHRHVQKLPWLSMV